MYIQKHTNIFSSTFHLNQLIKRPNGIVIYLDSTVIEAFKKEEIEFGEDCKSLIYKYLRTLINCEDDKAISQRLAFTCGEEEAVAEIRVKK